MSKKNRKHHENNIPDIIKQDEIPSQDSKGGKTATDRAMPYLFEIAKILLASLISIAATTFIITNYFYRPIAVIDLTALVAAEKQLAASIEDDQARIEHVSKYFENISNDIKNRKEIVFVKEAIVNPEQLKDVTNEYRSEKFSK